MKWTFFAGLGAGAAIGMLVAPKSGVELRDGIQEFAKENLNREKLETLAEEGRQRIQPLVVEARERVEPVLEQARESVQSAVDKARQMSRMQGNLLRVINEWSHDRLIAIDGIGPALASKIIQGRPYKSEDELIDAKTLPPSAIESLRKAA
jgi:DNA uptake protein ComE-like DNA-binding protein